MKARLALTAMTVVAGLVVGCGGSGGGAASTSAASGGGSGGGKGGGSTACLVSQGSGVNDRSFNQAAWEGIQAGAKQHGLTPRYIQAATDADYQTAAEAFTQQPCKLIVTNGFAMTDATRAVATRHPDKRFAIVDVAFAPPIPNVEGLLFDASQPAFLAGYLAAGTSRSGTVAAYGGIKQPPLTLFEDGFADGIAYYNKQHGTSVKLIGWDEAKQDGTFINSFTDQAKGKQVVQDFIDQGADVILTLAGLADQGAIAAAKASGGRVKVVWPNTDGCKQLPDACGVILTSIMKNMSLATQHAVDQAVAGTLNGGTYVGTLANGGVGIPALGGGVPSALAGEIAKLKQQIVAGKIKVQSPSTPRATS